MRGRVATLPREDVVLSTLLAALSLLNLLIIAVAVVAIGFCLLRASVHAYIQEPGVVRLAEDVLRAVAVVDIKVKNADPAMSCAMHKEQSDTLEIE